MFKLKLGLDSFLLYIFIFFSIFFVSVGKARAATYTVCGSGCSFLTINSVFDGNNLEPGDVIEVRADNPGETKIYREAIVWGDDDGGSQEAPVILKSREGDDIVIHGDSNSDGIDDIASNLRIYNVNYVEVRDLHLTHATSDGVKIHGRSSGVVIKDVKVTYSGNQAFQLLDYASATYYNIIGDNNADDGFSMHGTTTAVIYGGSFSNNSDGINFIDNSNLIANDIIINNSSSEALFPVDAAYNGSVINGVFTNLTINQSLGMSTDKTIYISGSNVDITINNLVINNIPNGSSTECIKVDYGASLTLNNFVLEGNSLKDGISVVDAVLKIDGGKISNSRYGINSNRGDVSVKGLEVSSSSIGVYYSGVNNLVIERSYFHDMSMHSIDIRSSGQVANIYNSVFGGVPASFFAVACRAGSVCNLYNNTFYSPNNLGSGVFAPSSTVVFARNNIFTGLANVIYRLAGSSVTASYNLIYNNTVDWPQLTVFNENPITGDPLFSNPSAGDFSLQPSSPAINSGYNFGNNYKIALSPLSVWPSSVIAVDQNLRGEGWEVGAYVYLEPESPSILSNSAISSSSIRYYFNDNSSDENGFNLYNDLNDEVSSIATSGQYYIDENNLLENTKYFGRHVKAYNNFGLSLPSLDYLGKYTLTRDPNNPRASSTQDSIIISIDSFLNDSIDLSGYHFSRLGNSSGWIKYNHWEDENLSCGTEYNYQIMYRNGDGIETEPILFSVLTSDCEPPVISDISEYGISSSSLSILWQTNHLSSSKIDYGLTANYEYTTNEINISSRVASHSIYINNLSPCATYHYRVRSKDAALNEAVSSDRTFTTTGCTASSVVSENQTSQVDKTTGGTLILKDSNLNGLTLNIPVAFATSSANFQAHKLDRDTVLNIISKPSGVVTAGNYVYELKALSGPSSTISVFDNPLSISIAYSANDVSNIDESSLKIYRWDSGVWTQLDNCLVNINTKTVTCETSHFSTFGLFGEETVSTTTANNSSSPLVISHPCSSVTYASWQTTCINSKQYRNVISKSPNFCSLTTEQRALTERSCGETAPNTPEGNNSSQEGGQTTTPNNHIASVYQYERSLLSKIIDKKLATKLAGRILLQVETKGQAWYLDPKSLNRYYLADGPTAYQALRQFGLGITNKDLEQIPVAPTSALPDSYKKSSKTSKTLTSRLKGKILLQVENRGEAWYVNPQDGFRYYLANGDAAYQIMRQLSLGITNSNIQKLGIGEIKE